MFKPSDMDSILSALTLKQYRPYHKLYKSLPEYRKHLYDKAFGNKDRIYFNDVVNTSIDEDSDTIKEEFKDDIRNLNDVIASYNIFISDKEENRLQYINTYSELISNKLKLGDGRLINTGKAITKLEKMLDKPEVVEDWNENNIDMIRDKIYKVRKNITLYGKRKLVKENLSIVISRHPYDVAGMSTDRIWNSCMVLPQNNKPALTEKEYNDTYDSKDRGGCYHYYIARDIEEGTCVAYLIDKEDTNINKPYARILIKPFVGVDYYDTTAFRPSIILWPENKCYSDDSLHKHVYTDFGNYLCDWCDSVNDYSKSFMHTKNEKLYNDDETYYHDKSEFNDEEFLKKPIEIYSLEQYCKVLNNISYYIAASPNNIGKVTIKLIDDIVFPGKITSKMYVSIRYIKNYSMDFTIDGNGHKIILDNCNYRFIHENIGSTGVIKNITFEGNLLDSHLFSSNMGVIENCINKCNIISPINTASCFCNWNYGTIRNCTNKGSIVSKDLYKNTHDSSAYGIARFNYGIIENCKNEGKLIGYLNTHNTDNIDYNIAQNLKNGEIK